MGSKVEKDVVVYLLTVTITFRNSKETVGP
jgi:hypothetical protein